MRWCPTRYNTTAILGEVPRDRMPLPNLPLVVTVACWAFNFVALKELYTQMTAPAVSLVRFALMYVLLVAICVIRKEPLGFPSAHRNRILLAGFLSMGVYMVLFLEGMRGTSAPEGAIVLATAPIFTYLFACVLKQERFTVLALVGAGIAFAGVAMVVLGDDPQGHGSLGADLLVLASAVVWALSVVVMRPALVEVSPLRMLTLSMPVALAVLIPYGWSSLAATDFSRVTIYGWAMFLHVAVLSGVVAFICFYQGIRQVGSGAATLYQFFVPPMAALFAWWVQKDAMNLVQMAGLAVVIVGVWGSSRARAMAAAKA